MKFAMVEGSRQEAMPKMRGECPACGRTMIAKCGQIIVSHWAHFPEKHCDPWWEHETLWHRAWKALFAEDQQEVVHINPTTGERHIADIKTSEGIVIELQNSAMNPGELYSREELYGRSMVWIVNGLPFKNNFRILSKLPDPESEVGRELIVFRRPAYPETEPLNSPCFGRESDRVNSPDAPYAVYHALYLAPGIYDNRNDAAKAEIEKAYIGHHFFEWKWARKVWYKSRRDIYLDLGGQDLWKLEIFNEKIGRCARRLDKGAFIKSHGGAHNTGPQPDGTARAARTVRPQGVSRLA